MSAEVVNRQLNIYINSGEAQKNLDALTKKEKELKDALEQATNPKSVQKLNEEIKKLQEPIEKATKKLTGELSPSVKDLSKTVSVLSKELNSVSKEDPNFNKKVQQFQEAKKQLLEARIGAQGLQQELAKSSNGGLATSINQLTRELPAFTFSAQTGFLAISNNLPIFFDQIQRTSAEVKSLRLEGKETDGVLKRLGSSFFSLGTVLSVGVTLLTVYGKEIANFLTALFSGKDALDEFTERQRLLNEAFADSKLKEAVNEVETVGAAFRAAKEGVVSKQEALDVYNKVLGDTLGTSTDLVDAEKKYTDNSDNYIKATLYRAAAQKALGQAADQALKILELQNKKLDQFSSGSAFGYSSAPGVIPGQSPITELDRIRERKKAQEEEIKIERDKQKTFEKIADDLFKTADEYSKKIPKFSIFGVDIDDKKRLEDEKKKEDEEKKRIERLMQELEKLRDKLKELNKDIADFAGGQNEKNLRPFTKELNGINKEFETLIEKTNELEKAAGKLGKIGDPIKKSLEASINNTIAAQVSRIENLLSSTAFSEADFQRLDTGSLSIDTSKATKGINPKSNALNGVQKQNDVKSLKDRLTKFLDQYREYASNVQTVLSSINSFQSNKEKEELNKLIDLNAKKKEAYKKLLDSNIITRKEYDQKVAALDRQQADKERQLRIAEFRRNKQEALLNASINVAEAVTKALTKGPLVGQILAGAVAAFGLVQIAQIASTKPPSYAKGGRLNGPSHSNGGMPVINPVTGRKEAEVEGGEVILSKNTVRNNAALVNLLLNSSLFRNGAPVFGRGGVLPSINTNLINSSAKNVMRYERGGQIIDPTGGTTATDIVLQELSGTIKALENRLNNGIMAYASIQQINKQQDRLNAIKQDVTLS